ncbi:hypothetical protein [Asaia prunellae]|uniref:hypothetical protein n=1 Tax=Asaia prunellae TaxID=610245 RepID=UPI0004727C78|nr:hypothetical protein [Asaia prunellae]
MTWRPSANILRPGNGAGGGACPSSRSALAWPSAALHGGGDYSVDFDGLLAPGEFVTSFLFECGSVADQAWTNLFGTIVTAWLRWKSPGPQIVTVCALSNHGNSHQVDVAITVGTRASLAPVPLPPAPQTPSLSITSQAMDEWLASLPTDPDEVRNGWLNNAGIPTRTGDLP